MASPNSLRLRCLNCQFEWELGAVPFVPWNCPRCNGPVELRMAADAVCDFCSRPNPVWAYDCAEFSRPPLLPGMPSTVFSGGWAACHECSALIENANKRELLDRSISIIFAGAEISDDGLLRQIRHELGITHAEFFRLRRGPRIPASEYTDPMMKPRSVKP